MALKQLLRLQSEINHTRGQQPAIQWVSVPDELVSILIKPSRQIEELLANFEVSWEELLKQEKLHVQQSRQADPIRSADSRTKEPATVLLASAGVVMALAPALARVLKEVFRRPVKVVENVLIPVEDSKGNVVKDANGNPTLHWVERVRLLEPEHSNMKSAATLKGPLQLELKIEESSAIES